MCLDVSKLSDTITLSRVISEMFPSISLQQNPLVVCWSGSNEVNLVLKVVDALHRDAGRSNSFGNV